ncbi:hypothetical protein MKX01_017193 [Papaver californicum]|nr:hypothetical protein MKX01_017193 [Papaver californicum]
MEGTDKESEPKSYRKWSKVEFFPEESFQNWTTHATAISESGVRFKDRFLHGSTDSYELEVLKKQSSVVGAEIFVLTGQEARNHAGPAIVVSYAISGLSALLSVFCYTEFTVEIPVAGGSFSYLRIELGDCVAFIAAGNILLEAVHIHISRFPEGYNLLDPIAVVVLLITNTIAMLGTRGASKLNWIASLVGVVLTGFVIIAGGVFQAAVLFWAYTGFDMVSTMAEETKNHATDIPIGLIGSISMINLAYCLTVLSLSMLQKYTEMDVNAACSVAFQSVGMKWAKYLVAGALKGNDYWITGRWIRPSTLHHSDCSISYDPTLVCFTLLVTICSACVALFSSLDLPSSVSSLITLFIFMLMAMALLVRRYYGRNVTSKLDLCKLGMFLFMIIGSSIGATVYYNRSAHEWIGHLTTIRNLGIMIFLPNSIAKTWGVPLVPWLSSLSIGINFFLIRSLGYREVS